MPIYHTCTAEGHQLHFFFVTGFEAYSRPSWDVQAHSISGLALKEQGRVNFKEMIMTTNLHWPITTILDDYFRGLAANIGFDCAFFEKIFSGFHRIHPLCDCFGLTPSQ